MARAQVRSPRHRCYDSLSKLVDVLAAAPEAARLFVGAAKGQASVVVWLAHVFRAFVRTSYARLDFDEAWLCGGCLAIEKRERCRRSIALRARVQS